MRVPLDTVPKGFLDPTYTLLPHLVFPSHPHTTSLSIICSHLPPSLPLHLSLQLAPSGLSADLCWMLSFASGLPPWCSEMSASLSNTLRLSSSLKMDEEAKLIEKQGIVSILGSDCERTKAASLRRTLSWDMSSRKCLAQHGFSHMRKIASSQQFIVSAADSSSSSEGEDEYEEGKEVERPGGFQTWSSILTQKGGEESGKSGTLPLPYVHPLVKRSSSSLSEKSLQVCTESLGSETGSEGFSSSANTQEDKQDQQQQNQHQQKQQQQQYEKSPAPWPPSSFPPPLPSLSPTQGPNVRFHTHRQNGRLVLEAVSVPTQNCFQAQRHGGRLVLTFANIPFNHEDTSDKEQDEEEEEEAAEELGQEFETFEEEMKSK
ncbi:Protein FAF-like, chloroplastic [Vitis vinifera]|uniref:Protein FAF-like, chloroplastic n=1 Tax=Vitis vinifera TaxID=29760 RepID=A0A438DQK1_VITVI|nr:Protein FAF-like, chloroplastic [Vitis vinifera]